MVSFSCYLEVRCYGCIQLLNRSWFFRCREEVHPRENSVESHISKVFVTDLSAALGKDARGRQPYCTCQ